VSYLGRADERARTVGLLITSETKGVAACCSWLQTRMPTALCNDTDPWCIYAPRAACQEDLGRKIGATLRAAFGRARLPGSTSLQTAISRFLFCGLSPVARRCVRGGVSAWYQNLWHSLTFSLGKGLSRGRAAALPQLREIWLNDAVVATPFAASTAAGSAVAPELP
jgi:hypothetical protein